MRIIEATLKDIPKDRIGDAAQEDDASIYVTEDTLVLVDGKPAVAYGSLDFDGSAIVQWAEKASFGKLRRLAYQRGKKFSTPTTEELYFGYTLGRQVFNVPPGPTRTTRENPDLYRSQIVPLYRALERVFSSNMPEQYEAQKEAISGVREDWRIAAGLFTQVVVNKCNVFSYHVDAMNFPGSWNLMAVFANGTVGGNTIIPGLDMRFSMRGAKYLIFNAQNIIHGVTPITKVRPDAYRYSLVYYAQAGVAKMGSLEDEMAKFRRSLDKRFDEEGREKRAQTIQKYRKRMQQSGYK